ncbi:MAG TPA: hypothetical protein VG897_19505, partial [Terriglobales bacterium]|nr:hypothetical protein [Terriglobales bacterium]
KLTGDTDSPAFDAIACDGAGNYVQCLQAADGCWEAQDVATRGFGKTSKEQLVPWIISRAIASHLP